MSQILENKVDQYIDFEFVGGISCLQTSLAECLCNDIALISFYT